VRLRRGADPFAGGARGSVHAVHGGSWIHAVAGQGSAVFFRFHFHSRACGVLPWEGGAVVAASGH
jgi:hypothetical protein